MAIAEDVEDQDTEVGVTVDNVVQLDVRPSEISYSDVSPGDKEAVTDEDFEHLDVENAGSESIQDVFAESDMPIEQPFGTTVQDVYNTGNFLQMSFETARDSGTYDLGDRLPDEVTYTDQSGTSVDEEPEAYVNRVEFFEENPPEYIDLEDGSNWNVGRFREGSVEYFFAADDDLLNMADDNEGELRIGVTPHTPTELGTFDFTDSSSDYVSFDADTDFSHPDGAGADNQYVVLDGESLQLATFDVDNSDVDGAEILDDSADIDLGEADGNSDVDFSDVRVGEYELFIGDDEGDDQDHALRSSVNYQPGSPATVDDDANDGERMGYGDGDSTQRIYQGTGEDALQPGQAFPVDISVMLPQGVDSEEITDGEVTFFASADGTAP